MPSSSSEAHSSTFTPGASTSQQQHDDTQRVQVKIEPSVDLNHSMWPLDAPRSNVSQEIPIKVEPNSDVQPPLIIYLTQMETGIPYMVTLYKILKLTFNYYQSQVWVLLPFTFMDHDNLIRSSLPFFVHLQNIINWRLLEMFSWCLTLQVTFNFNLIKAWWEWCQTKLLLVLLVSLFELIWDMCALDECGCCHLVILQLI